MKLKDFSTEETMEHQLDISIGSGYVQVGRTTVLIVETGNDAGSILK